MVGMGLYALLRVVKGWYGSVWVNVGIGLNGLVLVGVGWYELVLVGEGSYGLARVGKGW